MRLSQINKSQICVVRALPRYPASVQTDALEASGCGQTIDIATGRARLIETLRKGDVVKVWKLHLLAEPKRRTDDNPRRDLWAILHQIEDRGATVLELSTGRTSSDHRQRDLMIADAVEILTRGQHAVARKIAAQNGLNGGRPPTKISDEQRDRARALWFDLKVYGVDLRRILKAEKYTLARCYREFGPRGGK